MAKKLAINSLDVDLEDCSDIKGDIFHIQNDPEDPSFYCLVRERGDVCTVVGMNKDKNIFNKRIEDAGKF